MSEALVHPSFRQVTPAPASRRPRMSRVEAIVEPARLEELRAELEPWAVTLVWSEVHCRPAGARTGVYRGVTYSVDDVTMAKLEILAFSSAVPRVTETIQRVVGALAAKDRICFFPARTGAAPAAIGPDLPRVPRGGRGDETGGGGRAGC